MTTFNERRTAALAGFMTITEDAGLMRFNASDKWNRFPGDYWTTGTVHAQQRAPEYALITEGRAEVKLEHRLLNYAPDQSRYVMNNLNALGRSLSKVQENEFLGYLH